MYAKSILRESLKPIIPINRIGNTEEADKLFHALSAGVKVEIPIAGAF